MIRSFLSSTASVVTKTRIKAVVGITTAAGHITYYSALFFENHHLYATLGAPLAVLTFLAVIVNGGRE